MKIAIACDHGGYLLKQDILICLQAEMTRRHNDANMMALGAGITGGNLAKRMVDIFLHTDFEGGRHARRVAQLDAIR